MNEAEALLQAKRIERFKKLDAARREIEASLKTITEPWPEGPSGQGPFTGNTRESRNVISMQITFSCTQGGASPVGMVLQNLNISAHDFGKLLEGMLRERLGWVTKEIEEL